jgi:two-component system, response regulator
MYLLRYLCKMCENILHILIADDDVDDQQLLSEAIKSNTNEQVKISIAGNGLELMKYLEKRESFATNNEPLPDVILLDINMPYTNGLEALKLIKQNPDLRRILIYVVTTMRNFEKLEECLDLGANNFYTQSP